MAGYIGNIPVPQALRNYDVFTATSGQTVFNVKSYDPSFIDVYQNGVKLIDGDDYTATDGNTVVLASGATLNDIVEVISFTTFYPADVVSASAGGTFFGAVSFDGDVTIAGNDIATAGSLSNRNKIINGAMVIAQRTTGAITVDNTGYEFGVDRTAGYSNTAASTYTVQQSSVTPAGFKNSLVATVATAGTPAAGVENKLFQYVEGYNVAELGFGSSGAQSLTLSFWVRSSVTGTYAIGFFNAGGTRAYSTTYTISAADTFEYKQITIPGDTSGSWNTTNGIGFGVNWYLGAGSNFHIATGAWTTKAGSYAAADSIYGAGNSSGVNWIATAGATFYLTGVQLEVGDTATPFEHRSYGQELALCQRYYTKSYAIGTVPGTATNVGAFMHPYASGTGNILRQTVPFKVSMRASPTVTIYGGDTGATGYWQIEGAGTVNQAAAGVTFISEMNALVYSTNNPAAGHYYFNYVAESEL